MSRFRLLTLLLLLSTICVGQQIPIQFALTDTTGIELQNRTVSIKATLTSDTTSITPEYQETQSVTTNDFGIASFWIGEGNTTLSSSYSTINTNWLNPSTDYFIVLQVDSNGFGFNDLATIRYSLPLVAVKSQSSTISNFADTSGYALSIDIGAFKDSSVTNELQSLDQVLAIDSNAHNNSIYNLKSLTIGDTTKASSAVLAINSTEAGFLLPRMTLAQRNMIQNTTQGLMIYCTDCEANGRISYHNGISWELLMPEPSAGQPPIITTGAVENIGISTATFNASILDSGDTEIFASGFCWGTSPYPSLTDNISSSNLINSNGILKSSVFGLDSNSTYYVRSYASNGAGTTYGPLVQFTTDGMRYIGEEYGGGYVAYLFQPGDLGYVQGEQHGIIMYPFDYPTKIPFGPTFCSGSTTIYDWPNLNTTTYVIDSTKVNANVGYAIYNHNLLMTSGVCTTQPHLPSFVDTLNWNGYSDWMLPTRSDLLMIFNNAWTLNSLPNTNQLTENERYLTSCTNGIYSPGSYNATDKIYTVSFNLVTAGYPNYTQSVSSSAELKWYGSAFTFRPVRYF